jgi:hypothetical protein
VHAGEPCARQSNTQVLLAGSHTWPPVHWELSRQTTHWPSVLLPARVSQCSPFEQLASLMHPPEEPLVELPELELLPEDEVPVEVPVEVPEVAPELLVEEAPELLVAPEVAPDVELTPELELVAPELLVVEVEVAPEDEVDDVAEVELVPDELLLTPVVLVAPELLELVVEVDVDDDEVAPVEVAPEEVLDVAPLPVPDPVLLFWGLRQMPAAEQ